MTVLSENSTVVVEPDLVDASLGPEEIVILDAEGGQYYSLRDVGAQVWTLIQAPTQVRTIVEAISNDYDVDEAQCKADVLALLEEMREKRLINIQDIGSQ